MHFNCYAKKRMNHEKSFDWFKRLVSERKREMSTPPLLPPYSPLPSLIPPPPPHPPPSTILHLAPRESPRYLRNKIDLKSVYFGLNIQMGYLTILKRSCARLAHRRAAGKGGGESSSFFPINRCRFVSKKNVTAFHLCLRICKTFSHCFRYVVWSMCKNISAERQI